MPETEDESSAPTDFQEFSALLINGQRIADETKKSHFFTWRGYKACVSSEIPKFSTRELNRRYQLAMKSIKEGGNNKTYFNTTEMTSASGRSSSSSSSSRGSSSSISSDQPLSQEFSQELTQIPATQMQGN